VPRVGFHVLRRQVFLLRHFHIAKGSAAELITQLIIAEEVGYINETESNKQIAKARKIGAMLNKLIKARE